MIFPHWIFFGFFLERMRRVAGLQPQPPSFARVIYFPFSEKSNCNFERLWTPESGVGQSELSSAGFYLYHNSAESPRLTKTEDKTRQH